MEDTDSLVNAGSSDMEIRKRYNTSASAEEIADPDVNYQDASISSRSSMSDDEDEKVEDKDTVGFDLSIVDRVGGLFIPSATGTCELDIYLDI